jgi:uncharacterized membrane protein HdeD (DUF308 family)
MSEPAFSTMPAAEIALFGNLKKNWRWLLAFGILSVLLGTFGLGAEATVGLTLVTVLLFGWLLIVAAGFQLVGAFSCKGWKGVLGQIATAVLYGVAGYLIVSDPVLASSTFTLIIAGILIAVGLLRMIMAFQHRSAPGWIWTLLAGLISVVFGVVIVVHWPVSGLWVIGLFVAVELILNGWAAVFIALAARRAGKAELGSAKSTTAAA